MELCAALSINNSGATWVGERSCFERQRRSCLTLRCGLTFWCMIILDVWHNIYKFVYIVHTNKYKLCLVSLRCGTTCMCFFSSFISTRLAGVALLCAWWAAMNHVCLFVSIRDRAASNEYSGKVQKQTVVCTKLAKPKWQYCCHHYRPSHQHIQLGRCIESTRPRVNAWGVVKGRAGKRSAIAILYFDHYHHYYYYF